MKLARALALLCISLLLVSCGGSDGATQERPRGMGGGGMGMAGGETTAAVPVQVEHVSRRSIANALYTNGTLEAEREVDLIARASGPITELLAEEGDRVRAGQLLAKIDQREAKNQVAIAAVAHEEARLAWERSETMHADGLVSQEAYDAARSALDSASAQLENAQLQLDYTEIRAPFDALVVVRYIKLAQHVNAGSQLFRISDFTPLLCAIEVPEKDVPRLAVGQAAKIRVEAFPDRDFNASVLRIRPTVDAATGTVTVTLKVDGDGVLRPGMFASVRVQTEVHRNAVVIPRKALVLDAIGDTVFVKTGDIAARRNVTLGFREEDAVEVLDGLTEGEELVVLGQDGLAEGTPVSILGEHTAEAAAAPAANAAAPEAGAPPEEMLEAAKARMRERGLSDEEIEQRLARMREGGGPDVGGGPGAPGGELPPMLVERIRNASPEELERIKARMKSFGMDDSRIEETVARIRSEDKR